MKKFNIIVALLTFALTSMEGFVVNRGQQEQSRGTPHKGVWGLTKDLKSETPQGE